MDDLDRNQMMEIISEKNVLIKELEEQNRVLFRSQAKLKDDLGNATFKLDILFKLNEEQVKKLKEKIRRLEFGIEDDDSPETS